MAEVSREYEVVVYDDASTDASLETLEPYKRVLPLTVLKGSSRVGTGRAEDIIARHVARTTRYPRRDALLLMQGDFTDQPEMIPEFLKRFEGGADLIIGQRKMDAAAPRPVRRLFSVSRWLLKPFIGITDVQDLTSSFRLVRVTVLRDLIRSSGNTPVANGEAWTAWSDFMLRAAALSRRVETVPVVSSHRVRSRPSRRLAWADGLALARWGWSNKGTRVDTVSPAKLSEGSSSESQGGGHRERKERSDRYSRREGERSGSRPPRHNRPDREQREPRATDGEGYKGPRNGRPPRKRVQRERPDTTAAAPITPSSTDATDATDPTLSVEENGTPGSESRAPRRRRYPRRDRPNHSTPVSEHNKEEIEADFQTEALAEDQDEAARRRRRNRRGKRGGNRRRKDEDSGPSPDTGDGAPSQSE